MALTTNQISDHVQTAVGRPATDYEASVFANAPIQELANLKSYYGGLNKDGSIVDYLKYTGQDSSEQARTALGTKYGITGIGTGPGNNALLAALKSGKAPTAPGTGPAVPGSLTDATKPPVTTSPTTPTDPNAGKPTTGDQPASTTDTTKTTTDSTTPPTPDGTVDTDPDVWAANNNVKQALSTYQSNQTAVSSIDQQVASLRETMATALTDKEAEITKNGGLVNRAQIAAQVSAENQGVMSQIDNLLAQRAPLAASQSQASTALTQARSDLKNSQDNFYKSTSANQAQEKIDTQQSQFSQKLAQTGWKSVPVTSYDEYGDVVGKSNVWTQNPGATTGFNDAGQPMTLTTDKSGNVTAKPTTESSGGTGLAAMSKTAATSAPKTTAMFSDPTINITSPGYSTANVTFNGKNTQLTQSYIDQIARVAILNGGSIPAGSVRGTKGLPIVQTDAIKARMGQLDPGGNLQLNKAQATAWASAIDKQIAYATNLNRSLQSADADFEQVLGALSKSGLNSSIPLGNIISNFTKYNLGSADVASFQASLNEISRLYSQVFSNGGQTTDATNATAKDIINGNMSMDQLKGVLKQLQTLGGIDVQKANDTIAQASDQYSGIGGGIKEDTSKGSMDDKTFVQTSLDKAGLKYDDLLKEMKGGGTGKENIPVLDNKTGQPAFASQEEIDAGDYTPL